MKMRSLASLGLFSLVLPLRGEGTGPKPLVVKNQAEAKALPAETRAVTGEGLDDDGLAALAHVTGLQELRLLGAREHWNINVFTDAGLAHLAKLSDLAVLDLDQASFVTGEGLSKLPRLNSLRLTSLMGVAHGKKRLEALADLSQLTSMELGGGGAAESVADGDMPHLCKLTKLRRLTLGAGDDLGGFTDASLKLIVENLPNLEELGLDFATRITDEGLARLSKLSKLKSLRLLQARRVTDEGVKRLEKALPGCRIRKE